MNTTYLDAASKHVHTMLFREILESMDYFINIRFEPGIFEDAIAAVARFPALYNYEYPSVEQVKLEVVRLRARAAEAPLTEVPLNKEVIAAVTTVANSNHPNKQDIVLRWISMLLVLIEIARQQPAMDMYKTRLVENAVDLLKVHGIIN